MKDEITTDKKLLEENAALKRRITELEKSAAETLRVKETLRQTELYLRMFFEENPDAIFWADPETGLLTDCNRAAEQLTGLKREDIPGRSFSSLHSEEEAGRVAAAFDRFKKPGFREIFTTWLRRPDGEQRQVSITSTIINVHGRAIMQGTFRDITGYSQAVELHRMLTEKSFAGIYIVQNGRFRFLNRNASSYAGYTPEELIGMESVKVIHPEDREQAAKNAIEMIRGNLTSPYEFRVITKKGGIRWIMETVTSITYEGRRAILGNSMDVTDIKEIRQKLDEEKALASSLLDAIPHAVFCLQNRSIIFTNKASENVFGWKPEELVGQNIRHLYRSDRDYEETGDLAYSRMERERNYDIELPFRHKDGRDIICRVNTSIIGDTLSEGRIIAVFEDITEHRKAEEALRESQRHFSDIIEFLPDATFVIDRHGRVTAWNRAIEEMTGVKDEDILGKGDYEYALPFYGIRRPMLINIALEYDKEIEKNYSFVRKDEHDIWAETDIIVKGESHALWAKSSPLYDSKGCIVGAIESIRDITERKQSEEALRKYKEHLEELVEERTADLRVANEEIRKFTYIASHDMRAPLINIKGFTGELRLAIETVRPAINKMIPLIDEESREKIRTAFQQDIPEALGFISTSVSRMDSLISSILILSRLGRRILTFEPVDMNGLVQDILKTLAFRIDEMHVTVEAEPLPEVIADRICMEQIMGNLLDNAIKYLSPERRGLIRIRGEQEEELTAFHIQDNGRGIAGQDIPKIFDIFTRAGSQDIPGEGMGLAYVQTMVRRHGGHIWCTSEPGVETTFTFTILKKPVNGGPYDP